MDQPDKPRAFDQLSQDDQEAAMAVCVGTAIVGMYIPSTGKPLYDWLATEFASCRTLPSNTVKYALRSIGQTLFTTPWAFVIEKHADGRVITKFTPGGQNGETGIITP